MSIDLSILDHEIFINSWPETPVIFFPLVLFLLDKFRQNRRNDFLIDCVLEFLAGDKLESVAFPGILDTFL